MASDLEWAYFAGVVDGEGCITIRKDLSNAVVSVSNTNKELIDWIVEHFGGGVSKHCLDVRSKSWKTVYDIRWYGGSGVDSVLAGILPYLIVKKKNAEAVMSFRRLLTGQGSRLDVFDWMKREAIRDTLLATK